KIPTVFLLANPIPVLKCTGELGSHLALCSFTSWSCHDYDVRRLQNVDELTTTNMFKRIPSQEVCKFLAGAQRVGRGNTHSNACYSATRNPRPVAVRRGGKGDFVTSASANHTI